MTAKKVNTVTRDTERPHDAGDSGIRPETTALLRCLTLGEPPDEAIAQDFGLLTDAHLEAVRRTFRLGEVTTAELDAAWRDAREINRLVGSAPSSRFTALIFWVPPAALTPDRAAGAFAALGERHRRFSASAMGEWLSSLCHDGRADSLEEEISGWEEELGIGREASDRTTGGVT